MLGRDFHVCRFSHASLSDSLAARRLASSLELALMPYGRCQSPSSCRTTPRWINSCRPISLSIKRTVSACIGFFPSSPAAPGLALLRMAL